MWALLKIIFGTARREGRMLFGAFVVSVLFFLIAPVTQG
jgi:hypothetical protein